MPVKYSANIGLEAISIDGIDLASAVGAGSEFALSIPNQGTPSIAWQTVFAGGNPASITVLLQASLDGTNWFTIDTSTSTTGELRRISGSYKFIRVNNSAVTVGTGITLTASFVYSNTTSPDPIEDVIYCNNNLNLPTTGTIEQVLLSIPIPASISQGGAHVAVDFDIQLRGAANANAKTYNIRVGGIAGTAIAANAGDTTSADRYSVRGRMYSESTNDLYGTVSNCQRTGTSFIFVNAAIAGLALGSGTSIDICATTATAIGDLILTSVRVSLIRRS